jgi:hypothetical protein
MVRIQTTLEGAGVLFIDDDETVGIGLRLTKKRRSDKFSAHIRLVGRGGVV